MYCIRERNVNGVFAEGVHVIRQLGIKQKSRNGEVTTLSEPLSVCYENPWQRVLFNPERDANPFFHFFEALWLLAGRNDAKWLDRFVKDFSSRFAEEDGHLHGSYGYRWRYHFDLAGGSEAPVDQLEFAVTLLKADPLDRRVVVQMWDPMADLGRNYKDVPCNVTVIPRINPQTKALDITVFNRSNDFVWGLAGANAVQFSFLQEYLAGRIGVPMGQYYQISTNAHIYAAHDKLIRTAAETPFANFDYPLTRSIGTNWDYWDKDLRRFMEWTSRPSCLASEAPPSFPENPWFEQTASPMCMAHSMYRAGETGSAIAFLTALEFSMALDWRLAAVEWLQRRADKKKEVA